MSATPVVKKDSKYGRRFTVFLSCLSCSSCLSCRRNRCSSIHACQKQRHGSSSCRSSSDTNRHSSSPAYQKRRHDFSYHSSSHMNRRSRTTYNNRPWLGCHSFVQTHYR